MLLLGSPTVAAQQDASANLALHREIAMHYAARCHHLYEQCEQKARALQQAVQKLLLTPDRETLAAARAAWLEARKVYGRTEVLRFYDGPIEPLEPLLNAWPIDEAFVDYVQGEPDAGIVQDVRRFPQLSAAVLELANERGGETNVSVGWHAIEFLLWGQDLAVDGPGNRPASDYAQGLGKHAARRGEYLMVCTRLLVQHLGTLRAAWAPDAANYRARFLADPSSAIRRMLTGAAVLSGFEMTGERLAVAYETRDQEQEHSCFSDTTWFDFEANQLGIQEVFVGGPGPTRPGLLAAVRAVQPAVAAELELRLARTLASLRAIPRPFDAAMRGADTTPGRIAMRAALEALEEQTELIAIAGRALGHELPTRPGGF